MPEIGTSGSMSGDRKRGVGHRPQATAPILDSTEGEVLTCVRNVCSLGSCGRDVLALSLTGFDPIRASQQVRSVPTLSRK